MKRKRAQKTMGTGRIYAPNLPRYCYSMARTCCATALLENTSINMFRNGTECIRHENPYLLPGELYEAKRRPRTGGSCLDWHPKALVDDFLFSLPEEGKHLLLIAR
jgi:hypothetical protein